MTDADRARAAAFIHSIADLIANDPNMPVPTTIRMDARPCEQKADAEKLAEVDAFAECRGAQRYGLTSSTLAARRHEYATLTMSPPTGLDVDAQYTLSTTVDAVHVSVP